jgi:small subunit ribosomal protein S3
MDSSIRNYFGSLFSDVVKLKIEYLRDEVFVYLYISGLETFLSENGGNIEKISKDLSKKIGSEKYYFRINIIEVKNSYSRAQSVANLISSQLKKRMRSRMVIKNIISRMSSERDVKGIKIEVSGRLDESDISQTRKEVWGKMPLSTIDSNIEIGSSEAVTSYGKIGIKVLIYKGKI